MDSRIVINWFLNICCSIQACSLRKSENWFIEKYVDLVPHASACCFCWWLMKRELEEE
ncbi:hypothetical protein AAZX31_04G072700 [Glycine max]